MLKILKNSSVSWYKRDPFTHSAAIAYYTIFSFPALVIVLMAIAGIVFDEETVRRQILSYLRTMFGKQAASNLFETVEKSNVQNDGMVLFIVGVVMLLLTAIRLFMQLQIALNNIWGIDTKRKSWISFILQRAQSFGVMISIGFVLLVSLLMTTWLTYVSDYLSAHLDDSIKIFLHAINLVISYSTITLLFMLMIKMLPDKFVPIGAALRGGALSAFLFLIGEYALSAYFGISKPDSAYGVTGSIILLMLWVSYSCLILLFGAEFAKAYADTKRKKHE